MTTDVAVGDSGPAVPPRSPRRSRWDRPPPAHDWRWVVGTLGKVFIAIGLLMFAFVAYQLWGTGLEYSQAQDRLDHQFEELLAATPVEVTSSADPSSSVSSPDSMPVINGEQPDTTFATGSPPSTTTPPSAPPAAPQPTTPPLDVQAGDVLARIEVPSIGLDSKVVEGVTPRDLQNGPGHYPATPRPGQLGNSAIAGHRTTYGEPFADLDAIVVGDEIIVTTVDGRFVYRMTGQEIVAPSDADVVATADPEVARLTLTTCHPRFTAAQRLIVYADLDVASSTASPPAVEASAVETTPTSTPNGATLGEEPAATRPTIAATSATVTSAPTVGPGSARPLDDEAVNAATADAFAQGWFDDDAAFVQVALWGAALSAVAIGAYLLSRTVRRNWVGALAGIVPFVVVLYFFFQNVNRLLPAAL